MTDINEFNQLQSEKYFTLGVVNLQEIKNTTPKIKKKIEYRDIDLVAKERARTFFLTQDNDNSVFDTEDFFIDIIKEAKIESKNKEKIVKRQNKYKIIIDKMLNDIFDLEILLKLDLEELIILEKTFDEIKKKITKGNFSKDTLESFHNRIKSSVNELLEPAVEIWPSDKKKGENCEKFLRRVWGDKIFCEQPILRSELRVNTHLNLYQALSTHFKRNGVPDDLASWWNTSTQRKKHEVDKVLEEHDIQKPKDAFSRKLPPDEAQRLYSARKLRDANEPN